MVKKNLNLKLKSELTVDSTVQPFSNMSTGLKKIEFQLALGTSSSQTLLALGKSKVGR